MCFVRLIAAEEIEALMAFLDRLAKTQNRRESARFFFEPVRIDAALVGVRRRAISEMIFCRGRGAIEFQPRNPKRLACEQPFGYFPMETVELVRSEAPWFTKTASPPLMQVH
jgi:hypothetical protein